MNCTNCEVQKIEIYKLKQPEYNPRKDLKPGDPEYEKLKRSIEEFGYVEPVIWNKSSGNIVGGNQRAKVLKDLGFDEVTCIVVDLDDKQEKALNIALNKITGEWDIPLLTDLLANYTHPTSGATAGTYKSVTVDANGHVTGGSNPTTLAGYGITDAVASSDVVATATANKILKLDSNSQLPASVTGNAATATKLATARTISGSGDVTGSASFDGSANVAITFALANSGVTAGTYKSVTVDAKGRVTAGTNPTTLAGYGITDALTASSTIDGGTF